jgi:predicted Fe-Mo cluster-binding NifX family protein
MAQYLVAASGDNPDAKISGRFGHAKYFLLVDPKTMDYESVPGVSPEREKPDMARFAQKGAEKVLVGNIGPSAFEELRSLGLQPYLCRGMTVREAVRQVEAGEKTPMEGPTLKQGLHSPRKAGGEQEHDTGQPRHSSQKTENKHAPGRREKHEPGKGGRRDSDARPGSGLGKDGGKDGEKDGGKDHGRDRRKGREKGRGNGRRRGRKK